ncbi:MAG: DUF3526 domain-containing protein [Phenylobacterium sp.]|uniref:DUF3526 domain-containing protein n=1 Tax=Phenylobacterium sp. TaxID=1871053 RepID=UPI00271B4F7D|nr:DUF3526 domain-containing protein [Phenylobacterium sp.]MDO8902525.1 DUF3526 domain-containing protein [Phenylobacterium sp.]
MSGARLGRLLVLETRTFLATPLSVALIIALALISGWAVFGGTIRTLETRAHQAVALEQHAETWAQKRAAFIDLQAGRIETGMFVNPARADLVVMSHKAPVVTPPGALAPLSAGPAREGNDIIAVSMASRYGQQNETIENPTNRVDGPLDLIFVVAWLLPIVLLVLSYDVLAGDRETQISPLIASSGTPLSKIVLGRLGVVFLATFGVIGCIATAGVVAAAPLDQLVHNLPDLVVWLGSLGLYIGFWLALSASLNARLRHAAAAGVALLTIWITLSLVTPVLAAQWVAVGAAAPDRLTYVLQYRALQNDLAERSAEVRETYYGANPERRPVRGPFSEYEEYFVETYYPRQVVLDQVFFPHAREIHVRQVAQARRLRLAAFLSPPLMIKRLTDDLAGFAPERRLAAFDATEQFQAAWRERFDVKLASRRSLTLADYDDLPTASPVSEAGAVRLVRAITPLGGLLAGFLLAAALAWMRLRRAGP